MKLSFLKTSLLLVAASLGLSSVASAATTYASGDIFLGFRRVGAGQGSAQDILINIGNANWYKAPTGNTWTLPLGNLAADLSTTFGAGWATDAGLRWAVVGSNSNTSAANGEPRRTLYVSKAESVLGVLESAPAQTSDAQQTNAASKLGSMASAYLASTASPNLQNGAIQSNSTAGAYGNTANMAASGNAPFFNFWNFPIEGSSASGITGTALDLFRNQAGQDGTYLGTFTIDSLGAVSFVPEPASLSFLGASMGLLLVRRRRK